MSSTKSTSSTRDSDVLSRPIAVPPIKEQYRIVSKIEELFTKLDAGVKTLKNVRLQLQLYRKSLLGHAYEGKLTEHWRENYKNQIDSRVTEQMKEGQKELRKESKVRTIYARDLSKLPVTWIWSKLSSICELVSGQHVLKKDYNRNRIGMPYITGPADFSDIHPIILKWTQKPKAIAIKDDVLITVKGAGVGKVNILDIDKAAISRQVMAVRSKMNAHFLFYFFYNNFQMLQGLGAGSTVPGIDRESILNIVLPVPPLLEQDQIVEEIERNISVIDNIEKTAKRSLKEAARLNQSILNRAFEGKLLMQDPTDEPSSELLKRIKEDKSKKFRNQDRRIIDIGNEIQKRLF